MPNRILKESVRTSKKLNQLNDFEFRLWTHLITYVDDFGRGDADLDIIKGFVLPLRRDVTRKNIESALAHMESIGLIGLYTVDGESYLYFPNWSDHQRIQNKKSKYPPPHGDSRNVTVTHGEISPQSNPIQYESNPNTNPNPTIYVPEQGNPYRPDIEDVKEFIAVKGYHFTAEEFMEYYDSVNWMASGNRPITNWMAKCPTFERNWKQAQERKQKKTDKVEKAPDYIQKQINTGGDIDFESLDKI